MYGRLCTATLTVGAPVGLVAYSADDLPWYLDTLWHIVAGCTLLAAGLAVFRLLPRRED